jgi:hypothetical protein
MASCIESKRWLRRICDAFAREGLQNLPRLPREAKVLDRRKLLTHLQLMAQALQIFA